MMNFDKENCFNQLTNKTQTEEDVVSLIDEAKPLHAIRRLEGGSVAGSSSKGKRKFKKEEHYLKRVLLSRTSSPCPSLKSPSNLSRRSRSNNQPHRKQLFFKSPFSKPNTINFGLKRNNSLSSVQSELSSQPSLNDSFASVPTSLGKDLNTNQILRIKKEEKERKGDLPGLRKRVCRKVYGILNKEFKKSKILSKKLTLALEYRINLLFYYKNDGYIKTVKSLFKKLRVR